MARPTKYKPEFCEQLVAFFDVEPFSDVPIDHYGKDGEVKWTDVKRMANRLPTLRRFAKSVGVHYDTVYQWMKDHEEFSDAFTHAKDLQKWFLVENGLNGCYNPAFAIFTAKNITDMKDRQEVTGADGGPIERVIYLPQRNERVETPPGPADAGPADSS